ncbi:MAG: hypothetical protein M3Q48_09310 [Actinomycetota bacterium]|nr:hypothetical protein [Actinomycetota bacterium]
MAKARTRPRSVRTGPRRRAQPAPRWGRRNRWWIAAAAIGLVALVALVASGGNRDGDSTGASPRGFVGGDLHSLVADPTSPGRLFVGGHQAVSQSRDGGRTWHRVPPLDDADAMGWAFTADAVWVSGHPGLSRSTDGGRTFTRANQDLPDADVHAFGAGRSVLYGASPAAGVFASTDGGRSWTTRTERAGQSFFGRILVDPAGDEHLVAADARSGPVESTDGGRSWRPLGGLGAATWVSWAGPGSSLLLASGPAGAATSGDGGRSWRPLELPEGATLVEASATDPNLLYAAGLKGDSAEVWVSHDGGGRWAKP